MGRTRGAARARVRPQPRTAGARAEPHRKPALRPPQRGPRHDVLRPPREASAREQVEVFRDLWAYRVSPTQSARAPLAETLAEWSEREHSSLPTELKEVSEAYIADISYDPAPYLERLETPMLYLYGSEDINIPTEQCVARLRELADRGRPVPSTSTRAKGTSSRRSDR